MLRIHRQRASSKPPRPTNPARRAAYKPRAFRAVRRAGHRRAAAAPGRRPVGTTRMVHSPDGSSRMTVKSLMPSARLRAAASESSTPKAANLARSMRPLSSPPSTPAQPARSGQPQPSGGAGGIGHQTAGRAPDTQGVRQHLFVAARHTRHSEDEIDRRAAEAQQISRQGRAKFESALDRIG